MKQTLEDIKAKGKTSEPQAERPTPPEIKSQDCCQGDNIRTRDQACFLEENILSNKENRELKERPIIMKE